MRPDAVFVHGGALTTLVDVAGAAAVNSIDEPPSPTVDLCVDFLETWTSDLTAHATVDRTARAFTFVSVAVTDAKKGLVAKADGIYKR